MSAPVRVLIRADAGAVTGTGHFARASALADALLSGGDADIVLATHAEGAALATRFFPPGIRIVTLASGEGDPAATLRTTGLAGWQPEVVLLDQYGAVPEWEAQVARAGLRLIVLDDLDAAQRADLIVRPHGGDGTDRSGTVLRGPAWLPLSRHVTSMAATARSPDGKRLRLNICFGGSDPTGETAKALIAARDLSHLDIDVVLGPGAVIDPAQTAAAARMPHVTLHHAPSQVELAELIAGADFALGAGGVMLWERLCLGVPALTIAVADNQLPQIEATHCAGAVRYLGSHALVTPEGIVEAVTALAEDREAREVMSKAGRGLVDGRGAVRLAAWVKALALDWREVGLDDAASLLAWRSDDRNWQHNWDAAEKPALAAHLAWLAAKLADPACLFGILTRDDEAVGVVRFDLDAESASAYLSIYLVPAWHGRKMGLPLYFAAEHALRGTHPGVSRVVSRIHAENAASERLHRDAGFVIAASAERAGWLDAVKTLD